MLCCFTGKRDREKKNKRITEILTEIPKPQEGQNMQEIFQQKMDEAKMKLSPEEVAMADALVADLLNQMPKNSP